MMKPGPDIQDPTKLPKTLKELTLGPSLDELANINEVWSCQN